MSHINISHKNRNGRQITTLTAVTTDATGRESRYPFELDAGEPAYVGADREDYPDEPSDRAVELVEEWIEDHA
jgi:hypothetical protein